MPGPSSTSKVLSFMTNMTIVSAWVNNLKLSLLEAQQERCHGPVSETLKKITQIQLSFTENYLSTISYIEMPFQYTLYETFRKDLLQTCMLLTKPFKGAHFWIHLNGG